MLTPREREIPELVLCGESSKCIASALEISPKTVEAHRAHITKKLNVRSFNEITGKIFGKMISNAFSNSMVSLVLAKCLRGLFFFEQNAA